MARQRHSQHSGGEFSKPVVCCLSGSRRLPIKVAGGTLYSKGMKTKYELKAAANKSKSEPYIAKGIASP